MTIEDMLDLYQGWIDDYSERLERIVNEGSNLEAKAFCKGAIEGLTKACDGLRWYEKEGLEPCWN